MMKKLLAIIFILSLSMLSYAEDTAVAESTQATQDTIAEKTKDTAKLAEDQIPLNIVTDKKTTESGSSATKALFSGLIIITLLGASYYYVRKYRVSNTINKSNMQIKVLTQHYLGPKKSLAIVHVAGESILIGVTDTNISMIKSLSLIDDEVPAELPNTFGETLTTAKNEEKKSAATAASLVDELDEEFSFAGVTDTVSKKIKSMRRFS